MGAGDLLTPTLQEHEPRTPASSQPWRLSSQVYVAFFGGPVAVSGIAFLNARLLRAPGSVRMGILAAGAAGLAAVLVLAALLGGSSDSDNLGRLAFTVGGLAAYGGMYLLQRQWDRIYRSFSPGTDEEDIYAPLIGPGLLAVIVGLIVQIPLIGVVV